jgi:(1->4)-alpha-D-glucan 1-alpha-D-glucosylmutase
VREGQRLGAVQVLAALDADVQSRGREAVASDLMTRIFDHRLKLFTVATLLRFRQTWHEVFSGGAYTPVAADGSRAAHLFAFSRGYAGREVIVAIPRLLAAVLPDDSRGPVGERVWGDTGLVLPTSAADSYQNVLTDRVIRVHRESDRATLPAADVFELFPVALLASR